MRDELAAVIEATMRGASVLAAARHAEDRPVRQEIIELNKRVSALTALLAIHLELDHGFALSQKEHKPG